MTTSVKSNLLKAIKNPSDSSVIIYHAFKDGEFFNISAKRYIDKKLFDKVNYSKIKSDVYSIEKFLLEICHECLEPCHLKDVIEDYFSLDF